MNNERNESLVNLIKYGKLAKDRQFLIFSQYPFDFSLFCYSAGNLSIVIHPEGNCFIRKDIKLKHIGILKRI